MEPINDPTNDPLWEVAKKRTQFKKSLVSYLIVIPFLWAIWFFTDYSHGKNYDFTNGFPYRIPWPVWAMIGWGISLAFKFADAYVLNTKQSIENEYEKLKNLNK